MISKTLANKLFGLLAEHDLAVSLLDDRGNEVSSRVSLELAVNEDGTASNTNQLIYTNLPRAQITRYAIWDANTGEDLITGQTDQPHVTSAGGGLYFDKNNLQIGI